jgi:hypothetical protein
VVYDAELVQLLLFKKDAGIPLSQKCTSVILQRSIYNSDPILVKN